jgi:hypothetical protein
MIGRLVEQTKQQDAPTQENQRKSNTRKNQKKINEYFSLRELIK